jgi:xanthine dehydrogenase accessory factor
MRVWARLLDIIDRHGRAAMVTVAATRGSTPREAGARLIVQPDGGFTGTIGGGALEWRAIALAQAALARPQPRKAELRNLVLGPDMGQCCGGQVDLLFEVLGNDERGAVAALAAREAAGVFGTSGRVRETGLARVVADRTVLVPGSAALDGDVLSESFGDDRRPLLLCGAGHVGRALVVALAPLPFRVTWVDPRREAFPAHIPGNADIRQLEDPATAVAAAPPGSFILVMTHSHQLDLALVYAALAAGDRFPYVGLIGSRSKRARFEKRLAAAGIPAARVAGLVCPIGVPGIESKLPATIAAATTAQLILRDEALRAAALADAAAADPRRRGGRAV